MKREKRLFIDICVLGFVIMVLFLLLVVYSTYKNTESLKAKNKVDEASINILREYYERQQEYEADNTRYAELIETMLDTYPAEVREEDVIMLAVELQEKYGVNYSNINVGVREGVASIDREVVLGANIDGLDNELLVMSRPATLVMTTDYHKLKECISQIYNQPYKVKINNIALSTEQGDVLSGNVDLCFYSLIGAGKKYVTPSISEYISGTDNLFWIQGVAEEVDEESQEIQE